MDWETCFHCGLRRPVADSLGATGFRVTTGILLLCLAVAAALNLAAVWNVVRNAPARIAAEVATATPPVRAPGGDLPALPPSDAVDADGAPSRRRVATGGAELTPAEVDLGVTLRPPAMPRTTLATTARGDSVACGFPADSTADVQPLNARAVARAIAACRSAEELDSLEARVRAAHPDDPALRRGGRIQRRLDARRAVLARP